MLTATLAELGGRPYIPTDWLANLKACMPAYKSLLLSLQRIPKNSTEGSAGAKGIDSPIVLALLHALCGMEGSAGAKGRGV